MRAGSVFFGEKCMRQWVVVAPGRKFSVLCFLEVTSHSTFWSEPGRNSVLRAEMFGRNASREAGKVGAITAGFALGRRSIFDDFLREETVVRIGNFLKTLMCVLASVRNFSVVCFL